MIRGCSFSLNSCKSHQNIINISVSKHSQGTCQRNNYKSTNQVATIQVTPDEANPKQNQTKLDPTRAPHGPWTRAQVKSPSTSCMIPQSITLTLLVPHAISPSRHATSPCNFQGQVQGTPTPTPKQASKESNGNKRDKSTVCIWA